MDLRPKRDFLLLIDASSFVHRAYFATPPLTRSSDGLPTNALLTFTSMMLRILRLNWTAIERLPSHAAMVLDAPGKNWRHDLFDDYKAQRKPKNPDLVTQIRYLPTIAEAFEVPVLSVPGYEADDLIATLSRQAAGEGVDVVIASSDKDLGSLIFVDDDGMCIMYDGLKDKGREDCALALLGPHEIYQKTGVMPDQVMDFLALTGDTVDNVPGVPGIGPKTASRLLNDIGDLAAVIEAAEWEPERFKGKEAEKIVEYQREIWLSRQLVDLSFDVEVGATIDDLLLKPQWAPKLRAMMMDFEFNSLIDKVDRPPRP